MEGWKVWRVILKLLLLFILLYKKYGGLEGWRVMTQLFIILYLLLLLLINKKLKDWWVGGNRRVY